MIFLKNTNAGVKQVIGLYIINIFFFTTFHDPSYKYWEVVTNSISSPLINLTTIKDVIE